MVHRRFVNSVDFGFLVCSVIIMDSLHLICYCLYLCCMYCNTLFPIPLNTYLLEAAVGKEK